MGLEQSPKTRNSPLSLNVWIVVLGSSVTREDFLKCSSAVDPEMVPKTSYLKGEMAWRYIIGSLLPQFTMRKYHVPRPTWSFGKTKVVEASGKPFVRISYNPFPEKIPVPGKLTMGYSWGEAGSVIAYTYAFGEKHEVTNIGIGLRPRQPVASTASEILSLMHYANRAEEELLRVPEKDRLRRLQLIANLKDAYLKAIGQPAGFDFARITFNGDKKFVEVDGQLLTGWDFTFFDTNLDSSKNPNIDGKHLSYAVCIAIFRGHDQCSFRFPNSNELPFLSFIDISQIVRDVDRLTQYDGVDKKAPESATTDRALLSAKSSFQSDTATLKGDSSSMEQLKDSFAHKHSNSPSKLMHSSTAASSTTTLIDTSPHRQHSHPSHQHSQSQSTQYPPTQHTTPPKTQHYSPERMKAHPTSASLEPSPHSRSRSYSQHPMIVPIHSKGDRIVHAPMYPSFR